MNDPKKKLRTEKLSIYHVPMITLINYFPFMHYASFLNKLYNSAINNEHIVRYRGIRHL